MSVTQIDTGLSRYYSNKRANYFDENGIGKFKEWCDVNGYDTDGVLAELDTEPSECCLVEFDEDFPTTKKGNDRMIEIFNAIKNASKDSEFGLKKFFVTSIIKLLEKFAFEKADIVNTINKMYNKTYERYSIPDKDQIIIHTQNDMNKIIQYLYNIHKVTNKEIAASDTDPIKYVPAFPLNVLAMRTNILTAIIKTYYQLFNIMDDQKYNTVTDTIISYVPYEDCDKFIEEIYPAKANKKNYKMIIKDNYHHFFEQLELKYLCAIRFNRELDAEMWKRNCKDSNIIGKANVLKLNVWKDIKIDSTNPEVTGAIFNKNDIILNVDGNLEVCEGARIKSKNGTIILNVNGDIHLKTGAKIVTHGNIYIRCDNLIMDSKSFIQTYDFGDKYNKINHITLNYQLNKNNKRILYGDLDINIKNNLIIRKGMGCIIKSGNVQIKCGGLIHIKRMKHILALRNNVNINCNEFNAPMALIQKHIDARNKTMIKCNKLNIVV